MLTSHDPGGCQLAVWEGTGDDLGRTLLHLGNQLLVEQSARLLMQRAVDGDDVALRYHLLEIHHPSASDLLFLLRRQRLIVKVQQLLAVERLQAPQHPFADAADGDGADYLALKVVLILRNLGHVPVAAFDLLVGRDEVANEGEDGHHNMFGDRDDVGSGDFGDGDAAIGFVCGVEVDVVGADAGGDAELEVLRLRQAVRRQIAWVESIRKVRSAKGSSLELSSTPFGCVYPCYRNTL